MLEGKTVNLRIMEKEDVSLLVEWWNSLEYQGEDFPIPRWLDKTSARATQGEAD